MLLPLQSFAMQWGRMLSGETTSLSHEAAHDAQVQHHHDDDGSVHYDDSDESAQHLHDHAVSAHSAVLAGPQLAAAPLPLIGTVRPDFSAFIPDPALDSLLRPPAATPG
jgi:hypothetical protein